MILKKSLLQRKRMQQNSNKTVSKDANTNIVIQRLYDKEQIVINS